MAISTEELATLVKITGRFENSGDPYVGVSGNFDGQGISCGVLQWNIGQRSLQPLVIAAGRAVVQANMPTLGADMWRACNAPLGQGLAIVKSWQNGSALKPAARAQLKALMGSTEVIAQQDAAIRVAAKAAERLANRWAADRGATGRTKQELAWFFDVVTQNGSMKDLGFADVGAFKAAVAPGKPADFICDWLANASARFAGMDDCHRNAGLWRGVDGAALDLLILAYLRAQKSTLQWRGDVLNRKGTLAVARGWVHRTRFDLTAVLH